MSNNSLLRVLNGFQTTWLDYPDNNSLAIIVCMVGCDNCCDGCQNKELKDYMYKNPSIVEYTIDEFCNGLVDECKRQATNKVVLSGGDCLSSFNISMTKEILSRLGSKLDFCLYTGHKVDYCKEHNVSGFKFLKCGGFDIKNYRQSYKDDNEICFSSPNQELYDEEYNLLSNNGIYKF